MRIALLAMGSRGDVQPYVALGVALKAAGYDVVLAAPLDALPLAAEHGLATVPFAVDVRAASQDGAILDWQADGSRGVRHEVRHLSTLAELVAPAVAEGLLEAAEGADLVVSGALTYGAAQVVAEHRGLRHVLGLLAPAVPSVDGRSTMFAARSGGRNPLNLLGAGVGALAAYSVFRPTSRLVRGRLGLPAGAFTDYLRQARRTPTLLAVSPAVVPPARDWGRQVRVTGWWTLPRVEGYSPPPCLAEFLAAGPPPVYVGFGSMMSRDPQEATRTILAAVRRAGVRALLAPGWTGLRSDDLQDSVHLVQDVPHDWVLPQVAAVVHHGGSGTTAAAVRSGRPQVVVPHVGDQFYWARRMHELGVAAAPIRRHELDAEVLTAALTRVLSDPSVITLAQDLGAIVAAEDGTALAVELVDGALGARRE